MLRLFAALVAVVFGAYAYVRLTVLFDNPATWQNHIAAVLVTGAAAGVGLMLAASGAIAKQVGAFVWGIMGALAGGAIGFIAGFVGPLVLSPDDNLGPMLGFFTGPLGVAVGGLVGAVLARARERGEGGA